MTFCRYSHSNRGQRSRLERENLQALVRKKKKKRDKKEKKEKKRIEKYLSRVEPDIDNILSFIENPFEDVLE